MTAVLEHFRLSLRLHFRNRMALLYGYLFPLIFLGVFHVLYRHEKIPLLRHMGELLTVSVLGGACFGLPTTLVSERERGVWRRYRLTPVPTWALVVSTALARWVILLSAGLLQLGAALALGTTPPEHLFALAVAFTFVAFAFIGLGLVMAALADTVPAVQALGQCVFLPMLIVGGVAVPLASLPAWAQHLSAFLPGRYAVEALQACVNGDGLSATRFALVALTVIGIAGCIAGAKLFRWDAQQRFAACAGKAWLVPVLAAWLAVGLVAEKQGRAAAPSIASKLAPTTIPLPSKPAPPWAKITEQEIATLDYNLPPDEGIVAPMAPPDEEPLGAQIEQVATVRARLATWEPGLDTDEVQAVRNLLAVAAVPDSLQLPVERYLPGVALERLQQLQPEKEKLVQILTWIALHPEQGLALDTIADLGIEGHAGDPVQVRERIAIYATKFIVRLTGGRRAESPESSAENKTPKP